MGVASVLVSDYGPFALIPARIVRDPSLSANAKVVYATLWSYTGDGERSAFPGRKKLAEHLGASVRTLDRAVAELVAYGALSVELREAQTSIYRLIALTDDVATPVSVATPMTRGSDTHDEGVATPMTRGSDTGVAQSRTTYQEPGEESSSSEVADATPRPEIDHLLDLLDAEIARNGGRRRPRTQRNREAARLLLDRDGKTVTQVEAAIRWCQADEFWRANILSMSKLREKYDQLALAAKRTRTSDHLQPVEDVRDGILFRQGKPVIGGPRGMTPDQFQAWTEARVLGAGA